MFEAGYVCNGGGTLIETSTTYVPNPIEYPSKIS